VPIYLVFTATRIFAIEFSGTGRVMKRLPQPQLRLKRTTVESSLP
jgi:hypothetical protein